MKERRATPGDAVGGGRDDGMTDTGRNDEGLAIAGTRRRYCN